MPLIRNLEDERSSTSDLPEYLQPRIVLRRFTTWPLRKLYVVVRGPREADHASVVFGGWVGERYITVDMLMRADVSRSGGPWEVMRPHFAFLGRIGEYEAC